MANFADVSEVSVCIGSYPFFSGGGCFFADFSASQSFREISAEISPGHCQRRPLRKDLSFLTDFLSHTVTPVLPFLEKGDRSFYFLNIRLTFPLFPLLSGDPW